MSLFFALFLAFVGCDEPKVAEPVRPVAVVAPARAAVVLPVNPTYDTTFATAEGVATWQAGVNAALDAYAARPPITDATKWLGIYRPEPRPVLAENYGRPTWDAPTAYPADHAPPPVPNASAADAKALEDTNQKWPAARMYLQLGDTASAKRCAQKLLDEGSNVAAAQISVRTGDTAVLDAAVDKLLAADYLTRLREDVVNVAVWYGEIDMAMRVVERAGWTVSEEIDADDIRAAALRGDTAPLARLIESELAAWEEKRFWNDGLWPPNLIADIVTLARKDRAKALAFAKRFLGMPSANVVAYVSCGEGCGQTPMTGTFELYALVKSDPQLRAQYLERTRQWLRENGASKEAPAERYIAGQDPGYATWNEIEYAYLEGVRKTGDAEFIRIWEEALALCEDPFNAQMMRRELGLATNPKAVGLTPADQYVLAWITKQPLPDVSGFEYGNVTVYEGGGTHDQTESDYACDGEEGAESLGCLLTRMRAHGSPDPAKLKAAATELGLVLSKDDGLRVRAEELELTRKTIWQLGNQGAEACTLSVRLARSGYGEPNIVYDCAGQDRVDLAWLLVDRDPSILEGLVLSAARQKTRDVLDARAAAEETVHARLNAPYDAFARNLDASNAPNVNRVPLPAPASVEAADAIVATVLDAARARVPNAYRRFLAEGDAAGSSAFYDAEVARLTAANDLASLAALTNEKAAVSRSGSLDPR